MSKKKARQEDTDTVQKIVRVPVEINAKIHMRKKYLKSEGEDITLMELIERMIKPGKLKDVRSWELRGPAYVILARVDIPREKHRLIKVWAKKYDITDEMYIINLLNNQINE